MGSHRQLCVWMMAGAASAFSAATLADSATLRLEGDLYAEQTDWQIEITIRGEEFDAGSLNPEFCCGSARYTSRVDGTNNPKIVADLSIDDGITVSRFDGLTEVSFQGGSLGGLTGSYPDEEIDPAYPGNADHISGLKVCSLEGAYEGGTVCLIISSVYGEFWDDLGETELSLFIDTPSQQIDWSITDGSTAAAYDWRLLDIKTGPANLTGELTPMQPDNDVLPGANETIEFAIHSLSTGVGDEADFDATQIDPARLMIGYTKASVIGTPYSADADNDGLTDKVFAFNISDSGITCNEPDMFVYGETLSDEAFTVRIPITTINCPTYTIVPLPNLDGAPALPIALNNRGQVAGEANNSGFLYQDGAMTDLNAEWPAGTQLQYLDINTINDAGQIGGLADIRNPGYTNIWKGFIYTKGQFRLLDEDQAGYEPADDVVGRITEVLDINKNGAAIYRTWGETPSENRNLGLWRNGTGQPIAIYDCCMHQISNSGRIVYQISSRVYNNGLGRYVTTYYPYVHYKGETRQIGAATDLRYTGLSDNDILYGVYTPISGVYAPRSPVFYNLRTDEQTFTRPEPATPVAAAATVVSMNGVNQTLVSAAYSWKGKSRSFIDGGSRPPFYLDQIADTSGWLNLHGRQINNRGEIIGSGEVRDENTGYMRQQGFIARPAIINVEVGLDPWTRADGVDPASDDTIAIAVYSSSRAGGNEVNFDATRINPKRLRFGDKNARNNIAPFNTDLNNDTLQDAAFGFKPSAAGISCTDSTLYVYGETYDNVVFSGEASITPDCGGNCHP